MGIINSKELKRKINEATSNTRIFPRLCKGSGPMASTNSSTSPPANTGYQSHWPTTRLSNLRYVITEKPKWKVFKKREITAIPAYHTTLKAQRGCPCGNNSPCKQKVTPRGVTIHYPQKKKKFRTLTATGFKTPKIEKGFLNTNPRPAPKVKIYRPKKFPTWRLDKITYNTPYLQNPVVRPPP